ncbi:Endonuclease/exonuclease/phosphatase [Senna tora]|uniref:Endonuclease/exonuclease/phosphatase n=1 Tax=Senna tora TaxID=362788 RepID=A0A834WYK5_9FABA|nr:Endonuclease/exonuclease/phosphatase [Senna tora]
MVMSWLILGDMNQVLSSNEKLSMHQSISGAVEFRQFVDSNDLIDIHPQVWFTWTNGRNDGLAVWVRLDRALCNANCLFEFPHTSLCLPILCYDHSPLIINMYEQIPFRPRPFHFEAMWLLDPSCNLVLRIWNCYHFGQVQSKIKELQNELQNLQEVMKDIEMTKCGDDK